MKMLVIALMIFDLLLVSCVGDPVKPRFMQPGTVESIVVGKTTMADVQSLLGRPQEVRTVNDVTGNSTFWRYQYVQRGTRELVPGLEEALSKPAIRAILSVQFSSDQTVQKIERLNREIRTPEEGGIMVPW